MSTRRVAIDLNRLGLRGMGLIGLRTQTALLRENWGTRHRDRSMEICFVASGRQGIQFRGRADVLHGNDLLINHPGEWHSLAEGVSERCRIYYLSLDVAARTSLLLLPRTDSNVMHSALRSLPTRLRGDSRTALLFHDALTHARANQHSLARLTVANAITALLLHVLSLSDRKTTGPSTSSIVRRTREHILAHLHCTLDVPALAAVANLSPSRFHALFKRETGVTPRDFVLRCKIDAAKKLLSVCRSSVLTTSQSLAFTSSQYFSTVFRRYTGLTPNEFRQSRLTTGTVA